MSRTRLARLIADGAVRVNTVMVTDVKARVSEGDMVEVTLPVTIAHANNVHGTKSDDWYEKANTALANLIKSVYEGGESFDGLVQGIDYTGGDVAVLTDGATGYAVQAFFNIRYAFRHGNPFDNTEEV